MQRATFGVLGTIGAVVLIVWAVGWIVLGFHGGGWHFLFPVGVILCLAQTVWRVHVAR
jgi:hypothetical protein